MKHQKHCFKKERKPEAPISSGSGLLRGNKRFIIVCIAAFALTRFYMLFVFQPHNSDISLYAQFAFEYLLASKHSESFYKLHANLVEAEQKEALQKGLSGPMDDQKMIPYPPLAIQMLRIPSLFINADVALTRESFMNFASAYQPLFRCMLFIFDLINLILIIAFLIKRQSVLSERKKTIIALSYIAGVVAMPHILYDRLDLVVGTLLLTATFLLLFKKHYSWSFIALAAAVNYKISPIVVAPLFATVSVLSNNSGGRPRRAMNGIPWKLLLLRMAILIGFILVFFAPFAILFGKESVSAFLYQYERGLHIESVGSACALFFAAFCDLPMSVGFGYGALTLGSPLSQPIAAASGWLTLIVMIGMYAAIYRWHGAKSRFTPNVVPPETAEKSINQLIVNGQLLCVSALIVFSKNFSPQYLFWLLPLLFLMDFQKKRARMAAIVYMIACVLSTMIFPYYYFSDITMHFTSWGKILLIVRASTLVSFMLCMLMPFLREARVQAG